MILKSPESSFPLAFSTPFILLVLFMIYRMLSGNIQFIFSPFKTYMNGLILIFFCLMLCFKIIHVDATSCSFFSLHKIVTFKSIFFWLELLCLFLKIILLFKKKKKSSLYFPVQVCLLLFTYDSLIYIESLLFMI